jgi:branched-chain amino acid transport system substrate-binding protein
MRSKRLRIGVASAVVSAAALALTAALAAGASQRPTLKVGEGAASATKSVCGLGNGKKAAGKPIKIGGIYTLVPGIDFTTGAKITTAYFKCVNDNGGINGRPVELDAKSEQIKPDQLAALARQLVQNDKVVGMLDFSILDCVINHKYYESIGYYVIAAGVPGDCFGTPNIAAVNMGPRYSNIGAAAALVRAGVKGTMVISSPTAGGIAAYANGGPCLVAKAAGLKCISDAEDLPISDPNAAVLKLVQEAGPGGAVILDYTAETAIAFVQAAQAQGVVDKVLWGQSTPVADTADAKIGSAAGFDGRMYIGQEFNNLFTGKPDETLYEQITKKYAPSVPVQSFGQMGFLQGKLVVDALLSIKGAITPKSYNAAAVGLKNVKSDIWCKPWYFGKLPNHLPNNTLPTMTYKNGQVVQIEKCNPLPPVDPLIKEARAAEKKFKLNTG